jgi:hypothetical protein
MSCCLAILPTAGLPQEITESRKTRYLSGNHSTIQLNSIPDCHNILTKPLLHNDGIEGLRNADV